ncbi:hypothetical protein Y1Q_0019609 [Alligator mississippiensis]|uniref:Uncharacterized protein n=1 Tax=Alligator mississippiensis TaxID=8496 RepID=A0A151PEL4_ALLMI|nr:hypothetical protein Y1Q_0019609 [Alligator mississippiensis]
MQTKWGPSTHKGRSEALGFPTSQAKLINFNTYKHLKAICVRRNDLPCGYRRKGARTLPLPPLLSSATQAKHLQATLLPKTTQGKHP